MNATIYELSNSLHWYKSATIENVTLEEKADLDKYALCNQVRIEYEK